MVVFFLGSLAGGHPEIFDSPPEATAVLADEAASLSLLPPSSASEPGGGGGDANRVFGRGPEAEGPLGFFRIGFPGGFLDEDGATVLFSTLSSWSSCLALEVLGIVCELEC